MHLENQTELLKDAVWLLSNEVPFQNAPPFWVREVGRHAAPGGYQVNRASRVGYTLIYSHSGEGELAYCGKRYLLPAGSIVFLDCRSPYEIRTIGANPWTYYWLQTDPANCEFYYSAMFKGGFGVLSAPQPAAYEADFEEIISLMRSPQTSSYCGASHLVSGILTRLLAQHIEKQRRNTLHLKAIEETVAYIQQNYRESIDVDFLAARASLSKYYYIKLFKEVMHATPYEYLLNVRINEAKKLLLATDRKSAEIGGNVGFADECNFSRTFKRLTGITPIQYRKNA